MYSQAVIIYYTDINDQLALHVLTKGLRHDGIKLLTLNFTVTSQQKATCSTVCSSSLPDSKTYDQNLKLFESGGEELHTVE